MAGCTRMAAAGLAAAVAFALGGCQGGTIYKRSTLGDLHTLSVDARQRLAFVGDYQDENGYMRRAVCTEPSPDAMVARAEALALTGKAPAPAVGTAQSPGSISADFGSSSSESAASIAMRTQMIQAMRDGYFKACEGLLNGVFDKRSYRLLLANADATMIALAAVSALSTNPVVPAVAITSGPASAGIGGDGSVETSAGIVPASATALFGPASPAAGTMSEHQAKAIAQIALAVIDNAKEREKRIHGGH